MLMKSTTTFNTTGINQMTNMRLPSFPWMARNFKSPIFPMSKVQQKDTPLLAKHTMDLECR